MLDQVCSYARHDFNHLLWVHVRETLKCFPYLNNYQALNCIDKVSLCAKPGQKSTEAAVTRDTVITAKSRSLQLSGCAALWNAAWTQPLRVDQSWSPPAAFAVWLLVDSDTASGASPIILGLPLEEANFHFRLPSLRAACCLQSNCLQSDARMELELRDDINQWIFAQVASLHAVNS